MQLAPDLSLFYFISTLTLNWAWTESFLLTSQLQKLRYPCTSLSQLASQVCLSTCLSCPLSLILELFFLCSGPSNEASTDAGSLHSLEIRSTGKDGYNRALMYNQQSAGPSHLPVPLPLHHHHCLVAGLGVGPLGLAGVGCWLPVLPLAGGVTGVGRGPRVRWISSSGKAQYLSGWSRNVPSPKWFPSLPPGHQGSSWDGPGPLPPLWSFGSGHSLAFWLP